VSIRPYRPDDDADIAEICMRTGHAGQDARPFYPDGDLLPDVYARPYLRAEPELAFVADDAGRAVGYLVGTADTERFVAWFRREWLPVAARRHGSPGGDTGWPEIMLRALHDPERMVKPELRSFPAHLHVNLLPEYQRIGLGRRLLAAFLDALAIRGVPAVHVAHGKYNISARVFYKRVGFVLLDVADPDPVRYLGRTLPR
jgi:GNAT superfamily N-acetyltransferase